MTDFDRWLGAPKVGIDWLSGWIVDAVALAEQVEPPPSPTSCTNLGIAKAYRMPLFCGTPESLELAGGGLPPSPVIGDVEVELPADPANPGDTTKIVPFIIGGSTRSCPASRLPR